MKSFYRLLGVTLLAITTSNFVWFALTYWAFLETQSVIATSTMGGIFLVVVALSGFWLGSIVDHHKKKTAMLGASVTTLILFAIGATIYATAPADAFSSIASIRLWAMIVILLSGSIAASVYNIAVPTLIGLTVPEERRDKANGMFGTTMGISFGITSVASGLTLAFGGMAMVLWLGLIGTALTIVILMFLPVPEPEIGRSADLEAPHAHPAIESAPPAAQRGGMDLQGTMAAIRSIPGLWALVFFTTFNNFLGGIFFALMDAYGLTLVSVQTWGTLWGVLSFSFILGGLYISRHGLGADPLRTLFRNNMIAWTVCIFFTIQPSILLLAVGTAIWMFFGPFTEAIENTIFQKVVPPERLGRVLGFAHSVEQAASPLTAFIIGPIAQLVFIPFMTNGSGVDLIGSWYGVGTGRGIALVFTLAGMVGLAVTLLAKRSRPYALLAGRYRQSPETLPTP